MQATYFRYLLHLHRHQVACLVVALGFWSTALGQSSTVINLPSYTERFIHYGFGLGLHSSRYAIRYSDRFGQPGLDSLHSIVPESLSGFKVGFISNFRVLQYMDLRVLVTIALYENKLLYRSVTGNVRETLVDAAMVEVPLLVKYRSVRRKNIGMYLIGGITPAIEARGKDDKENSSERLLTKSTTLALEAGVGFDMYFPFFKFSPEIRYSWGLTNILNDKVNSFSAGLDRVTPHNFTLYITFEGGPS